MIDLKQKFIKIKNTFRQKYWTDPVWSKVIAAVILTIGGSIFTVLFILVKSFYENIPFKAGKEQIIDYFKLSTELNNLILWLSILIIIWALHVFITRFTKDIFIKIRQNKVVESGPELKTLPVIMEHSTVFFSTRLAKAFPGQRGLKWYEPKTSIERLKILFQEPLRFISEEVYYDCMPDPIWWFRGGSAMFIDNVTVLSKTKILMGSKELEIKRIAVYISELYYKSFIYVETKAEKQTGLYKFNQDDIKSQIDSSGYSSEAYALLGKVLISHEDYFDGATVIKGKVVNASNASYRERFLSDYNFVIAAKQSPYNSRNFNDLSMDYFQNILQGSLTPEQFFEFLKSFEKYEA